MKLEIAEFPVKGIRLGRRFNYDNQVLAKTARGHCHSKVRSSSRGGKSPYRFHASRETQQFMSSTLKRENSRTDVDPPIKRLKGARIWKSDWDQIFRAYDDLAKSYREVFKLP